MGLNGSPQLLLRDLAGKVSEKTQKHAIACIYPRVPEKGACTVLSKFAAPRTRTDTKGGVSHCADHKTLRAIG
jgi:hypothetical protein